eukprot:jgi/Mesvir1/20104/Mv13344-RA.1
MEMSEKAFKVAKNLEMIPFAENVRKALKNSMTRLDSEFVSRLDETPHLVCFKNGVVDLRTKELRPGKPEDMISLSTMIDYDPSTDQTKIKGYIRSVVPDEDTARYLEQSFGTFYIGANAEETSQFWIGEGRNGKGVLNTFLKAAMGEYQSKDLKASFVTRPDSGNGAPNPELCYLRGKRLAMITETSNDCKFLTDRFKSITGNDEQCARFLYSNKLVSFTPQFKLVTQTNHEPQFSDIDQGLLSRIVLIRFPYFFGGEEEINTTNPLHRLRDPTLKMKKGEYQQGLAALMVDEAYKYINKIDVAPKSEHIKEQTKRYLRSVDDVGSFMESIELIPSPAGKVDCSTLLDLFKEQSKLQDYPLRKFIGDLRRLNYDIKQARVGKDYKTGASIRAHCIMGYKLVEEVTTCASMY